MKKFERLIPIYGEESLLKLQNKKILIIGLGGVGGFVVEACARTGIKTIGICDGDIIELSNFNRQIIANDENLGKSKVIAMKERINSINKNIDIDEYNFFVDENSLDSLNIKKYDLIIDCIDDVKAKVLLIEKAKNNNVEIISCMGTANKENPNSFKIADINQTSYCPLAKKIRIELRKRNIQNVKVCYSNEVPNKNDAGILSSQIFVVASASFVISKFVIDYLFSLDNH